MDPEQALAILQQDGYLVNSINDQIARVRASSALEALTKSIEIEHPLQHPFQRPDLPSKGSKKFAEFSAPSKNSTAFHYLDVAQILDIHEKLVKIFAEDNDPIAPSGIKFPGLLESATYRPLTSLGSVEKYNSVTSKAAALFHSLVLNHPFHNGNKRTALVALLVFLDLNKFTIEMSDDEIFDFVLTVGNRSMGVALENRADEEVKFVEDWLRKHSHKVSMQSGSVATQQFLDNVAAAGGRYRESGSGAWVVWGPKGDKSYSLPRSHKLKSGQVRIILKRIGLTYGQSGIYYEELSSGVDPNQSLIRRFRNVLRRLSSA